MLSSKMYGDQPNQSQITSFQNPNSETSYTGPSHVDRKLKETINRQIELSNSRKNLNPSPFRSSMQIMNITTQSPSFSNETSRVLQMPDSRCSSKKELQINTNEEINTLKSIKQATFGRPSKSPIGKSSYKGRFGSKSLDSMNYSATPSHTQVVREPNFYTCKNPTSLCEISGYNSNQNYESFFDNWGQNAQERSFTPGYGSEPDISQNSENYNPNSLTNIKYQPFNKRFSGKSFRSSKPPVPKMNSSRRSSRTTTQNESSYYSERPSRDFIIKFRCQKTWARPIRSITTNAILL